MGLGGYNPPIGGGVVRRNSRPSVRGLPGGEKVAPSPVTSKADALSTLFVGGW